MKHAPISEGEPGSASFYSARIIAESVGEIAAKAKPTIPLLIELLDDRNVHIRDLAADALARAGKTAVPAIIEALRDGKARVREAAAVALGRIGKETERAIPSLYQAMAHKPQGVSAAASAALGKIGMPAFPVLIQALRHKRVFVRRHAVTALWHIAGRFRRLAQVRDLLVPALVNALSDGDPQVRMTSAQTLHQIGPAARKAVPALIKGLEDESLDVRQDAFFALEMIGEAAFPALTIARNSTDDFVTRYATWALERIEKRRQNYIQDLKHKEERVRQGAAKALKEWLRKRLRRRSSDVGTAMARFDFCRMALRLADRDCW